MTSWEWVEENPVMTQKQFERFCRMQQVDAEFVRDCEPFRVSGGYDSERVVGLAGY